MKHPFSRIFGVAEKLEPEKDDSLEKKSLMDEANDEIHNIPLKRIVPNRFQPRTIFDEEKIDELAKTIHTHGMIQPIVVRPWKRSI